MTNGLGVRHGTLLSYVMHRTDIGCTLTPVLDAWQNKHPDAVGFLQPHATSDSRNNEREAHHTFQDLLLCYRSDDVTHRLFRPIIAA